MMKGYDIFLEQLNPVCEAYPKIQRSEAVDGTVILRGEIDIVDDGGKFWESYQVEIHPEDGFPFKFPRVFEVGGKLPRIGDWHIYEDTGSCCIAVEPEERYICRNGIRLLDFIKQEVFPYFFNQTYRRVEGYYKNGEYAHGIAGIYQFFEEILETVGNLQETIRLMYLIAGATELGRTHLCFCGSNQKYRRCHRAAYQKLKPLGDDYLRGFARLFAKAVG